jgi:hypothetical protein
VLFFWEAIWKNKNALEFFLGKILKEYFAIKIKLNINKALGKNL